MQISQDQQKVWISNFYSEEHVEGQSPSVFPEKNVNFNFWTYTNLHYASLQSGSGSCTEDPSDDSHLACTKLPKQQ